SRVYLGNAGTAVRFLTALATYTNSKSVITCSKRMRQRPMAPLLKAVKSIGGKIKIPGNISSQFISALLMISPLAKTPTTIKITGEIFSKPYIKITLNLMRKFGIKATHDKELRNFKIAPNQKFKPCDLFIEGDASSASYLGEYAALKSIAQHSPQQVTIGNIPHNSIQGDIAFISYLRKMGCKISHKKNLIKIESPTKLKPLGEIDMNKTPDLVPTFAVLAALAPGTTKITNIANLRIKESDRISALAENLRKIGTKVKTGKDFIEIHGDSSLVAACCTSAPTSRVAVYNDHRIAMAFGVLKKTILPRLKIENPSVVKKSYPEFWSDLNKLNRSK
ncbi:MAG: 3-phosphoshikimate 1-carboxyvinyltransferase, partial [Candidatus Gracilibacteria bacterium]